MVKKVHLLHPHQNVCVVEKESLFSKCQDLDAHKIPLISNMETVINAIWESHLDKTKNIAVCGFGNIGSLLATTLLTYHQKPPLIIENDSEKSKLATNLGFEIAGPEMNFDLIYHTTASSEGLQYCIEHTNDEGEIIELSWYGNSQTTLSLGSNFHTNRLRLIASQVSKIPSIKREEYDYEKRKELAVKILKNPSFDRLISEIIPLKDTPKFFDRLRRGRVKTGLIYLIKY